MSKYGQLQLNRKVRGSTGQIELYVDDIKKIKIFVPSESLINKINGIVRSAFKKIKLSEQRYRQAEEKLYELLSISKEEIERLEVEKTYETNFKEVREAFRFDAEYYHPKYYLPNKIFKKLPYVKLGDSKYFILKKGIEVGSNAYCDRSKGILFLRVSNLSKEGLKMGSSDKYIFKGIYEKLRSIYEPKKGEVLFSKDGTIGTAVVVDSDFPRCIISSGIVRICIKEEFNPFYLAFVLNSTITQFQVAREKTGSVIEHLRFSMLREIKVPKLSQQQQEEIATLIKEHFNLRKEARHLIQKAIREVEGAIENASRSNRE